MKNTIYDYVDWRGDLSFLQFPFHEVDYLILSELAYVHLDDILELNYESPLTLEHLFYQYTLRTQGLSDRVRKSMMNESHFLFEKMAHSLRYKDIQVISYVNDLDEELIKQFAAVTFILEDETICVAYRGTGDALIGWHEDFLMLCEKIVPAQLSSVEYLKYVSSYPYQSSLFQSLNNKKLAPTLKERLKKHFQYKKGRPIRLVGHSKGGNLAMYSGSYVSKNIQDRIIQIYNYDGPGFQDEIKLSKEYKDMLPLIHSYIPHYSFFGIILGHEEDYSVVHSHYTGMLQHNGFSWDVTPFGFVSSELSLESTQFTIKVNLFLDKLSYEDKRTFVDAMFHLIYSLGLSTFSDLSLMSYKHILSAIKELTLLDPPVRKTLLEVIHMLWLESKKTKRE